MSSISRQGGRRASVVVAAAPGCIRSRQSTTWFRSAGAMAGVFLLLIVLASCGGSKGVFSGIDFFGPDVRDSFSGAIDHASGDLASGAQWVAQTPHCTDQRTGVQLNNFTKAEARKQPAGAVFNCNVAWQPPGGEPGLPNPSGSGSGSVYILSVKPDGSWQASLQSTATDVSGNVVVPRSVSGKG